MTVYVDDMYLYRRGRYGRMKMSHMMADTREELLAMADCIGVPRRWLQKIDSWDEHFDVCKSKRSAAVRAGAEKVSMREIVRFAMDRDLDAYANADSPEAVSTQEPRLFP